ncbi:TRAP transporter small permease [Defluviimonas sp. WL0002]|uniref:TRAP transporter small permease protein n=1 Tax=Albidovulum marisflavi TaxID=2984159 RepID=A0ABT2ZDT0_9RHOB|nr:TRAP transporter small permease [Defluviimonas sp. WL0002]MCV2869295.1 TRAP transporter small permease [Defluviimonas sp. WL0002]
MRERFLWLDEQLYRLEGVVIFAAMAVLIVMLALQVLFRFVLDQPLDFTEEAARLLFAWLVFIGAARAMRVSQHFIVDLVYNALPASPRQIVGWAVDALSVAFAATLAWIGFQTTLNGAGQILPVMGISVAAQTIALPVGMALMAIHAASFPLRNRHVGDNHSDEAYEE